ncbi:RecX family transcriptional regulator [Erythrobacter sp. F6033]|uniref:regulatory protein RecX n=1 Tax=Erythrobacter sp. F6033 TaxID=2926401 RepID=UPI001FF0F140|nr:RecX family transcriptional regulator [Erythrobacter sp. F6033]MCK0129347.1 RecX family transcriptional regulator [Erythrobacter sp. F6033]
MNTFSSSNNRGKPGSDSGRKERRDGAQKRVRKRKPLDQTALRDLALSYAARFATTGAKLESYLARKIRERGTAEDSDGRTLDLDVPTLVARLIELGYVNDDAYARAKSRDLTARGYGARRVEQALWAAGVDEGVREDHAPTEATAREAAALLAKKRRFGVYSDKLRADEEGEYEGGLQDVNSHKLREKQVAAMLRAGHKMDHVRFIMDASAVADVEQWIQEALEEQGYDND